MDDNAAPDSANKTMSAAASSAGDQPPVSGNSLPENPFASIYTSPTSCEFVGGGNRFPDPDTLIESFLSHHRFGQIVGPHGCGKTTLAIALAEKLDPTAAIRMVTIRKSNSGPVFGLGIDSQWLDQRPSARHDPLQSIPAKIFTLVDGIESLSLLNRQLAVANLRRLSGGPLKKISRIGNSHDLQQIKKKSTLNRLTQIEEILTGQLQGPVVITCHHRLLSVPLIAELEPSLSQFTRIVNRLMRSSPDSLPEQVIQSAYADAKGNYREAMWQLFDDWQGL